MPIDNLLAWAAVLIFLSVVSSKISDKFSVPVLLLFLAIGMLAGSEGIGGIYFDDASLAKSIGIVALIFILFSGGLDTNWKDSRGVIWPSAVLSTIGVFLTAIITGLFAMYILNFSMMEGMLLGAIVSSTDAAAVFSVLKSRNISLRPPLKSLLEFESGSNDPMAVFLTIGIIGVMTGENSSLKSLFPQFILDMGIGALAGFGMAKFAVYITRKLKFEYEGLYPVTMISLVLLSYSLAEISGGNGFLSVYLFGLLLGNSKLPNKKTIIRFHDGIAWLMQIVMFVALGLLVFPSKLLPLAGVGLAITALLIFVSRPLSVFISLIPFKLGVRNKLMISWVGLRGSVPIILATFPLMAGVSNSNIIFNVVFFVVIASVLLQGMSIPLISKLLKVDAPLAKKADYPIEFEKRENIDADLLDLIVPDSSEVIGKSIGDLNIPKTLLIVLISRNDKYVIPSGSTTIEAGDVLLVLGSSEDYSILSKEVMKIRS